MTTTKDAEDKRNSLMASAATNTAIAALELQKALEALPTVSMLDRRVVMSPTLRARISACLAKVAGQLDSYAIEFERRIVE